MHPTCFLCMSTQCQTMWSNWRIIPRGNAAHCSSGTHAEVRNLFTLVVFDTLYPSNIEDQQDGSS
uniref:Uncharacterized protein n=1 Tax=Arundo donax TaxID=35708 RepID=A0A0A9P972_ARUDO